MIPRWSHRRTAKGRRLPWLPALALAAALLPAPAGAWDPPGWRRADAAGPGAPPHPAALPLLWLLRGYRSTVSRVDGDRCPSHPTCSRYATEAVGRYGPLLGAALTAGRLLGEADEAAFAPRIFLGGRWKVYAPVEDDLAFWRGPLDP
ncbi:MAG: hypothetical protein Kow0092_19860 [Deferrisomatales bacterium]